MSICIISLAYMARANCGIAGGSSHGRSRRIADSSANVAAVLESLCRERDHEGSHAINMARIVGVVCTLQLGPRAKENNKRVHLCTCPAKGSSCTARLEGC